MPDAAVDSPEKLHRHGNGESLRKTGSNKHEMLNSIVSGSDEEEVLAVEPPLGGLENSNN